MYIRGMGQGQVHLKRDSIKKFLGNKKSTDKRSKMDLKSNQINFLILLNGTPSHATQKSSCVAGAVAHASNPSALGGQSWWMA